MSCPYEFLVVLKGPTRKVGALENPEFVMATTVPQRLDRTLSGAAALGRELFQEQNHKKGQHRW